jgi:hypothetical protein
MSAIIFSLLPKIISKGSYKMDFTDVHKASVSRRRIMSLISKRYFQNI